MLEDLNWTAMADRMPGLSDGGAIEEVSAAIAAARAVPPADPATTVTAARRRPMSLHRPRRCPPTSSSRLVRCPAQHPYAHDSSPTAAPAPTTPATTAATVPPTTPATVPPTTLPPQSFPDDFAGVASQIVIAEYRRSTPPVRFSVARQSGWVSQVETNGPDSVVIRFFKHSTHDEAQFAVERDGGELKVSKEH